VRHKLIVVTASSSNHFGALLQMLRSLRRVAVRVECYDIGLADEEWRSLPQWDGVVYRRFDYAAYPPYMNVAVNAGEYAWKPVIIAEVVERVRADEEPSDVLWADAGCFFHGIETIASRISATAGLWVRTSPGTMRQWTHPLMFEALNADPNEYGQKRNADATLVGFATGSRMPSVRERVYREIILPWKTWAMVKDCIAPPGSSRKNHRQDQALLSYLVHRARYDFATDKSAELGVRCKCDRWFYHHIGFDVPGCVYARTCLS
jgi:hypothetical protein